MKMKCILLTVVLAFSSVATNMMAQACTNASLYGKFIIAGQGDTFSGLLCGLGICTDTTVSTVGYVWFDQNGNLASPSNIGQPAARLFQATNTGVTDTTYTGSYSVTDCDHGSLSLTPVSGGQTLTFNLSLSSVDGPHSSHPNFAHTAVALDADPGSDESLKLTRTLDPFGCGTSSVNLGGVTTHGYERRTDPSGAKTSLIVTRTFASDGTFTGTDKRSTQGQLAEDTFTGSYTVNTDCTVQVTETVNNATVQGAHILTTTYEISSFNSDPWVWQGDGLETAGLSGEAQCGNGQVVSCCNASGDSASSGGLLGGVVSGSLGGSCSPIPSVVNVPINQACGSNQAACCTGDQSGLVNVQCTSVLL